METLKRFAFNSSTSSQRYRKELFDEVFDVFDKQNENVASIPDAAYKLLGKMIYYLFPIYIDKESKTYLIKLNDYLIKINIEQSFKTILASLDIHAKMFASNHPSRGMSNLSLYGQDIVNSLIESVYKHRKNLIDDEQSFSEELSKIAHIYSKFVLGSCSILKQNAIELSYKKFKYIITKIPVLVKRLEKGVLGSSSDTENPCNKILFLSFLLRFYQETNNTSSFNDLKNVVLNIYLNDLIGGRSKAVSWLVKCSNQSLKYVNRDDFKEKFVSELKRSLLRNPEIVMETIGYLLNDLTIDLSDFESEFVTSLGSQLLSKDESIQNESAAVFKSLSAQCSSQEAIQHMIKHLFFILNGGEGKLSSANQKLAMLTAIGNCTNIFTQSSQEVLLQIMQSFVDYLKIETHEPTQVYALQQLNKWLKNFKLQQYPADLVKKLNDNFKVLIENKSFSNSVRGNIYRNMTSIYSIPQLVNNIANFSSTCMAIIEKAQSQATQNNQITFEALAASHLLSFFLANDISNESKVPNFLTIVTDSKKQLFTNEKFLFSLNEQGLGVFCSLSEKLIEINSNKEKLDLKNFFNGYIFALFNPHYSVRKHAQDILIKLFKWNSVKLVYSFLSTIEPALNQFQLESNPKLSGIADQNLNSDSATDLAKWPSSKGICECLLTLSTIQNLTQDELEQLTTRLILLANLPLAKQFDTHLFEKCVLKLLNENKSLDIKLKDLIKSQTDKFMDLTIRQTDQLDDKQLNSIETLTRLDYKNYLKSAIEYSLDILNQNLNRLVTITRQEYDIMKTKEGDLYDKSLIENFLKQQQDSSAAQGNIRRENKTYSYKEQLAEMELRKELEAKKGTSSQKQTLTLDQIRAQMSKKQQEMLDAQIQREAKTREEMKHLDKLVDKSAKIILKSIDGNSDECIFYLAPIIRTVIKLLKSPLCINYLIKILKQLTLSEQIIYCCLRLIEAPVEIDSCWLQEPINETYPRLISQIRAQLDSDLTKSVLYYPLIKLSHSQLSIEEKSLKDIIEIIFKFCQERSKELDSHLTIPDFRFIIDNFLSTEYLSLLLNIIKILDERKLNLQLQYKCSDVCKLIVEFENKILGNQEIELDASKDKFFNNYNSDLMELCNGLFSSIYACRETCLQCLAIVINSRNQFIYNGPKFLMNPATYDELKHRIIVECYDCEESNQQLASKLWREGNFESNETLCLQIADDIIHPVENVRLSSATALAHLVKDKHPNMVDAIIKNLLEKYAKFNVLIEPKKDQFGRVNLNEQPIDEFEQRAGIAQALVNLAECIPTSNSDLVLEVFKFFVNYGLNDRNQFVRNKMLEASISCLNFHGKLSINNLLPLFESFLQNAPKDASYDSVRQNVVILMGTLAKHLDKDDSKVAPIIGKLVQALQTPSQQVQEAVANCLPPLMPSIKNQVPEYVNQLLNLLLSAQTYGERRGAAYGLAGMLKGVGMLSLKQLNVLQRLNDAVNNKQDAKQREGALIGYEMLTIIFNKVFEPYSVEILPNLLLCFGDTDANVRQAADDCAKAIMANLTFTGVKMILPKLLERLGEEESWRTKCGSVELLGNMAHCAPKQLSTCLPNIVPKLIEVLSDSHVKVQKAGAQALRHIGSVIKNPEIQAITNTLLEALQDPALKTHKALQVLLETKFVHFIDAPSLALIMPVVKRAFQDRSTEIRKMAAQIMGNMYSLTDQKDLLPYLPSILPGLKLSLLDPVPEVRTVSSKALGAMIKAIGENGLNEIISWLMEKLVSETSSVDRSGAAQGLSEVFGALGVAKLEKSMPEIIERAAQVDLSPYVRDGYMMMFIYLPLTFGEDFTPYVGLIIQPILKALADDSEFVRDTAIKAGQRIVNTYAETAISLFLPELEKGLFDSNWRIRFSSVQLLGDLLYKISGVIGKMTTESAHEDDNFGTEKGSTAIIKALGEERRNKIYSGLYMGRSDTSMQVRQAALHVWKIIVSNTPRTLKEILPTLFNVLLGCLASANHDKRQIAATTLVDIVKKLGERILPDIIPIFERGLKTDRSEQRQGVCIALSEIMANTSRDNIIAFSDSLIPTVRYALMDPLPEVRTNAAKTFDNLHAMIGVKALEDIGLSLYEEIKTNSPIKERAIDGLKQIMIVKSRALLPFLIPHLTQPPVNINALCKLCCFASTDVLSRHLGKILQTLVLALASTSSNLDLDSSQTDTQESAEWIKECESLLLSISDPDGIKTIVSELLNSATQADKPANVKSAALDMLTWFCSKTESDYSDHYDELIRALLNLFTEKNQNILQKAWSCLNYIIEPLKGSDLTQRLPAIRQSIRLLSQFHLQQTNRVYNLNNQQINVSYLPGFCLPKKGISCILPVFKEGLLNGSPDIKEQSAQTLCECIKLSDGDSLKSSVMAITGPLIRVLGERYSWSVKSAILDAIYFLLLKVDVTLRPFLPQLQPTFLKNLNDINRTVRLKSGYALAKLLFMNPKLDQIVLEVLNYTKNTQDNQIKETLINTLRLCINNIGSKLTDDTKSQLLTLLKNDSFIYNQDQSIRSVSSGALGSLLCHLSDKDFDSLLNDLLDYGKHSTKNWIYLQANCMTLATVLQYQPVKILQSKSGFDTKLIGFLKSCATSDRTPICMSAIRAICFYIDYQIKNDLKSDIDLATVLAKCINQSSNEVKLLSVQIIIYLSIINQSKTFEHPLLKLFIPMLVNGTREKAITVRSNSEMALVSMLRLNQENSIYNDTLKILDSMKESFEDCVKSLSKQSYNIQAINLDDLNIDETILKLDS